MFPNGFFPCKFPTTLERPFNIRTHYDLVKVLIEVLFRFCKMVKSYLGLTSLIIYTGLPPFVIRRCTSRWHGIFYLHFPEKPLCSHTLMVLFLSIEFCSFWRSITFFVLQQNCLLGKTFRWNTPPNLSKIINI